MRVILFLVTALYLVTFIPAFAMVEGNNKIDLNSKQKKDATLVQQAITKKCGSEPSACRTDEMDHYAELLKHITTSENNYREQSEKIQSALTTFKTLTDQQKTDYLYARFVHASIAGCKHEAIKAKTVLPSFILHCVKAVEPQNREDSVKLRDQVEFRVNGRTDPF